MADEIQCRLA